MRPQARTSSAVRKAVRKRVWIKGRRDLERSSSVGTQNIKRLLDILAGATCLVAFAPFLCIIYLSIRTKMGSPVLFRQIRAGLHGRPFVMYKLRTMLELRDHRGAPLPDRMRLTSLGRVLRRTSLDELPELFNVLRGDMSLVGPRPLLMEYLQRYSPVEARRHEVRPGITGWAQVNGRNALSWEDKFRLDVWYVDHFSLALDVKILWMTLRNVLTQEGISAEGHATMPVFLGSQRRERSEN